MTNKSAPPASANDLYQPWFDLNRCPHCEIASPNFSVVYQKGIGRSGDSNVILNCASCDHLVMVKTNQFGRRIAIWPQKKTYSTDIPERARKSLEEARAALAIPSLSIVGAARAVDFMLSAKGFAGGPKTSLAGRIRDAASQHVITPDMKEWADEVRLDANAERHADVDSPDPTLADAERALGFAEALAEILFELPAKVTRGRVAKPMATDSGGQLDGISRAPRPIHPL